jgi:hypothetical protein
VPADVGDTEVMPIEAWWPKLPPATTGWLRANNGDAVPDAIIERIAAVGRPATADAW